MNIDFKDKVVVITGAEGGIGSEMVRQFAENGAKVAICDLRCKGELEKELNEKGYMVKSFSFNVASREEAAETMKKIVETFGKIDILINNAGINVGPEERKTIEDFSDKWWDAINEVDLSGVFCCSKAAIPHMTGENASIINVSSIAGIVPLRNQCAFAAAKAGVINLSKAMAMELAPKGIRVNVIAPGTVGIEITNELWKENSAMQGLLSHIPMARQAKTSEIANAAIFLGSEMATYITGVVLPVDGGWTCGGFARDF